MCEPTVLVALTHTSIVPITFTHALSIHIALMNIPFVSVTHTDEVIILVAYILMLIVCAACVLALLAYVAHEHVDPIRALVA
jgi:membrane-bound acyltransferase YfiQ involved in biofilm formation